MEHLYPLSFPLSIAHSPSLSFPLSTPLNDSQMTATDRGLVNAFKDIGTMADKLNLPRSIVVRFNPNCPFLCATSFVLYQLSYSYLVHIHTQDRCNALFKQVHEEKHLKGRANDAVAAACLYIACRQEEVPRSFKEICAVSRHPKKEIGKCFKLITRQTNTIVTHVSTSDFMVYSEPLVYVALCAQLVACFTEIPTACRRSHC